MSDIEYSVITSDVIKSFDCTNEPKSHVLVQNIRQTPKDIHNKNASLLKLSLSTILKMKCSL